MSTPFHFSIETPSGTFISGDDITEVEVLTFEGKLGIMARHEPIVAACPPGKMRICQDGEWTTFYADRSLLVSDGTQVKLLTAEAHLAI